MNSQYIWGVKSAIREGTRGRFKGGIIIGLKKTIVKDVEWNEKSVWLEAHCRLEQFTMCIIAVYNNLGMVEVKNCWQKTHN